MKLWNELVKVGPSELLAGGMFTTRAVFSVSYMPQIMEFDVQSVFNTLTAAVWLRLLLRWVPCFSLIGNLTADLEPFRRLGKSS